MQICVALPEGRRKTKYLFLINIPAPLGDREPIKRTYFPNI